MPHAASSHDAFVAAATELASAQRELGFVRASLARARAEAWYQSSHLGVTERKETVHAAVAEFTAQAEELQAEVEALKTEMLSLSDSIVEWPHGSAS